MATTCFSTAIPSSKSVYLAFSIILCRCGGNISSHLSIFPDDNADIFAAVLLMLSSFYSSLVFLSIALITPYISFLRVFQKHRALSERKIASQTKMERVL